MQLLADMSLPPISISGINCNSLNMSDIGSFHHLLKIYGITRLKSDFICLSDIRLCNKRGVSNLAAITQTFLVNPYSSYQFLHNSHSNKRGVGILIKKSLNCDVLQEVPDLEEDNFLLLRVSISGSEFIIGCIYGPNSVVPDFFDRLKAGVISLGNLPIILVGDWNCTFSSLPANINPDILNSNALPNIRHTRDMLRMCNNLSLNDPFRSLNPNRLEYTYFPSDPLKKNRSRLDFFLVSEANIPSISLHTIAPGLQNKLFDHKAISISFRSILPPPPRPTISHAALRDPDLDLVVALAVADTYLSATAELTDEEKTRLQLSIGEAKSSLRLLGPSPSLLPLDDRSVLEILTREGNLAGIRECIENFPFPRLRDGAINGLDPDDDNCDDFFMEGLMNNVRNEVVSHQCIMSKKAKASKNILLSKIEVLKLDHILNCDAIAELENSLNKFLDLEMRQELSKIQGFEELHSEKITPFFF